MKIGKPCEIQPGVDVTLRSGLVPGGSRAPRDTGEVERPAADEVRLTRTSRSLVGAASDPLDAVRTDKVEEVRNAIVEGHFQVRAQVVAERMITEAAQLLETLTRAR